MKSHSFSSKKTQLYLENKKYFIYNRGIQT